MTSAYDLVIVGTGTAATAAADAVQAAGWRVAVIDFRPFGGTCALRGCDPKKVLAGGARAADSAGRRAGKGIAGRVRVDWPELLRFKQTFTDPVPQTRRRAYAEKGIDTYSGKARFVGPGSLKVGSERLEARYVLIAAGAQPIGLGIRGEEYLITSEEFLSMERLPRRIALVGGGYVAAEFAGIAAVAGVQVTIVQRGERLLKHFDPDLVDWLTEAFETLGIDVRTQSDAEGIEEMASGYAVRYSTKGRARTVEADVVVHAAGRAPALAELDLEAAGVQTKAGRLCLNEYLQSTSNPAVYAAGDAAQTGPPLTPVAGHDARVVAANMLEGNHVQPNYRGVPSVAFSLPPIAAVGVGEREAMERALKFRVNCRKASDWYTARQAAQPTYGFKVLVEEDTDRILGAHLVGPHADEVINLFALAMRHGLTAGELKTTLFAYPTGASDIGSML